MTRYLMAENESNQDINTTQFISGIVLSVLGAIGLAKSQSIKSRYFRIVGSVASVIVIFSGIYLFGSGLDDTAIGRLHKDGDGQTTVGSLQYDSKENFKLSLINTFKSDNGIRRLKFKCKDNSESFRVFNTAIGIFGVPSKSIACADGSQLLKYKN